MFTHLHLHTEYSLLDGAAKIKDVIKYAKELSMKSLAITDHGVMYGVVDFYNEAKNNGIKPIIGCEVYTAAKSRFDRNKNEKYGHLILLAKNQTGYVNLMKICSIGFSQGYYYKPRIDFEVLQNHHDGLVALSGCLKGDVNEALLNGDYEKAKSLALKFKSIFKDDYYLEVQNHNLEDEIKIIPEIIRLSKELGIKLAATNDVHYTKKENAVLQDIMLCIQTGKKIHDENRLKFATDEFYLKSEEEMRNLFKDIPEAIENTNEIAEKCNVELDFSKTYLPKFDEKIDADLYLEKLCTDSMDRLNMMGDEAKKRLKYELDTIKTMGYSDYFLIVWDYVNFARKNGISVGPGRGSAAGSLAAYLLGITEVNPLKYNLIFERFLNPERVTMPDIDIDFCYVRRQEVIDYIYEKYGRDRVAQIVAFDTMKARAAVRDVGRVYGISYDLTDKTAKLIPRELGITIDAALQEVPELKKLYDTNFEVKRLIDISREVEGMPRNITTHAAGLVIGDKELNNYVPTLVSDNTVLTQYPAVVLEKLGLVKMDLLALRNLTIIDDAVLKIKENEEFDLENIKYDDKKVYEMISCGETDGVFQLESDGMKAFLKDLKPSCFEDLIAGLSLYRPATAKFQIPLYIKNRKNAKNIKYKHPLLESILKPTYGSIVYQEQAMEIFKVLAGYSLGRADLVRRAMAKKKHEELEKEKDVYLYGLKDENGKVVIPGCLANGVDKDTALSIFDELTEFSKYAFNKSHATAYAMIAYNTAYLKLHYPQYYLASLLENMFDSSDKLKKYINDFKKSGVNILPPSINKSKPYFSTEKGNVRFSLSAIKGVGKAFAGEIAALNKTFSSFEDFLNSLPQTANRRCVESLIKCGAFDEIAKNRRALLVKCDCEFDSVIKISRETGSGQMSMFGDLKSTIISHKEDVSDFSENEKLEYEKELTGMYFSGNPFDAYRAKARAFSNVDILTLYDMPLQNEISLALCGLVGKVTVKKIPSGEMAVFTLEDASAETEVIIFNKGYQQFKSLIAEHTPVCIFCRAVRDSNDRLSITAQKIYDLNKIEIGTEKKLYVKIDNKTSFDNAVKISSEFSGNNEFIIYNSVTKEVYRAEKKNFVTICNELIKKMDDLLGRDNVKIK